MQDTKASFFSTSSSSNITISDCPPSCANANIHTISSDDFIKRLQAHPSNRFKTWSNEIDVNNFQLLKQDESLLKETQIKQFEFNEIKTQIEETASKLAVCLINEEIGYGLFSLSVINKDTCIAFYSGKLKYIQKEGGPYSLKILTLDKTSQLVIDATEIGGFSRFINHGPSKENNDKENNDEDDKLKLEDYEFTPETLRETVATANVKCCLYLYGGLVIAVCKTVEKIEKNTPLLMDYGRPYWLAHEQNPLLFDKFGMPLKNQYKATNISLLMNLPDSNNTIKMITTKSLKSWKELINVGNGRVWFPDQLEKVYYGISEDDFNNVTTKGKFAGSPVVVVKPTYIILARELADKNAARILRRGIVRSFANNNSGWKYVCTKKNNVLFLSSDNEEKIKEIKLWLLTKDSQLEVKAGENKQKSTLDLPTFSVMIFKPDDCFDICEILQGLAEFCPSEDNKQTVTIKLAR